MIKTVMAVTAALMLAGSSISAMAASNGNGGDDGQQTQSAAPQNQGDNASSAGKEGCTSTNNDCQ
jgi:hypothetical protein